MRYLLRFVSIYFLLLSFSGGASEVCPIFSHSVQSWSTSSTLSLGGSTYLNGTHNLTGNIGFSQILNNADYKKFCDKKRCSVDHSLLIAEPKVRILTFGTKNFTYNFTSESVFIPEGDYDTVVLNSNIKFTFIGSKYHIKKLIIKNGAKVYFPNKTHLFVNTASFIGGAIINVKDNDEANLSIWAENTDTSKAKIEINIYPRILPNKESFSLMGSLFSRGDIILNGTTRIRGSLTAHDIFLKSSASVSYSAGVCTIPAVIKTDHYSISMFQHSEHALICGIEQPTFVINTLKNSELVSLGVNVEILPLEHNDIFDVSVTEGRGSGLVPHFHSNNNGELEITIAIKNTQKIVLNKEYRVKVTLDSDINSEVSGQFIYVPFKFKVENQSIIAGKPKPVDVSVVGCGDHDGSESLISNYSGLPTVFYSLEQPSSGRGYLSFFPEFQEGVVSTVTKNLIFDNSGVFSVILEDPSFDCTGFHHCPIDGRGVLKGRFTVKSRPWTFSICHPTGHAMDGYSYGGSRFIAAGEPFELQLKPIVWQQQGSEHGTDENRPIEVSSYCDADVTTNFFLSDAPTATVQLSSELASPINGRYDVVMEAAGSLDRLNTEKSDGDYYRYDDLSWQEVGSLYVIANTKNSYLGMNINLAYREIGRFYPHHFKLVSDNEWNYAMGHNGFAYMNQPISMNYRVIAKNSNDKNTENFGYFSDRLKAGIKIEAIETLVSIGTVGRSLNKRFMMDVPQHFNHWNKATYEFSANNFMFLKDPEHNPIYKTIPDGPYDLDNMVFGVAVDPSSTIYTNEDNINFDSNFVDTHTFKASDGLDGLGVAFFHQPDFRYGRMIIDSVNGPTGGPISVPLRTEYWNKTHFVVNVDDNGSRFKPDVYYVMSQVNTSSAKLSSLNSSSFHTVSQGRSQRLQAKQDNSMRETVRLFLKQGNLHYEYANNPKPEADEKLQATDLGWVNAENIGQPWLQFNWRGKGDEDPSAVISFGAYRGNDRIIYRGEPNVTVH